MSDSVDPIQSALDELHAFGLLVERLEFGPPKGGKVHRVDVEGQKRGKKSGWYIAYEFTLDDGRNIVVGSYGIWQGAENNSQKLKVRGAKLDDSAREKLKKRQQELAKEAEEAEVLQLKEVATRAKAIWDKLPSCDGSPYLMRKGVTAYGLGRGRDGTCVVPLRNSAGMLTQLQFIAADGDKKFLTGPGKLGSYHRIGTIVDELPLVFAEGYATAASIHMATGWPVVACIDANNMLEVGRRLRPVYPEARFIFAADDDHEKKRNTGREIVTEGAKRFRGKVVFPRFVDPAGKTDFNDVHEEQGLEAVRQQLQEAWTPSVPASSGVGDDKWTAELVWGDKGLKAMPHNLMLVFEHHKDWRGKFAYDQFAKRLIKRTPLPCGGEAGELTDADEIEIAAWFGRRNTFAIAVPTIVAREACIAQARRYAFHPIREYLDGLKWDGEPRIATFLSDFCNTPHTPLQAGFATNFFTAAVARVRKPGCKADLMLVLEGEQGAMKSSLLNVLAGDAWYVDLGTPPSDKDFYQIIQGKWIVELGELGSFAKAETSHIKRAISVRIDRFRPSYGRNAEDHPRECVFVGTVNNSDWQRDETGARRYMPQWVSDINLDAVRLIRDQLWAEADHLYKHGAPWWVLPEGAYEAQESRYVEDIWAERVWSWLEGKAAKDRYRSGKREPIEVTTASEILLFALDVEIKKQDKPMQTRIGNLMKRFGFGRKQKRLGATRVWQYTRPPSVDGGSAS